MCVYIYTPPQLIPIKNQKMTKDKTKVKEKKGQIKRQDLPICFDILKEQVNKIRERIEKIEKEREQKIRDSEQKVFS